MPHVPDLAAHAAHDPALIAAHAAGDIAGSDLATATALVASCPSCAALHRDLRAIAAAVADLPAPGRPRDFRLTAEQAASLRPAGWRGLLGTLAGPRFSFAVPLGTGLATLGLAAILLGSVAGLPLGAGGAASREATEAATDTYQLEAPVPAASGAPAGSAAPVDSDKGAGALAAPTQEPLPGDGVDRIGNDLQAEPGDQLSDVGPSGGSAQSTGVVVAAAGGLALLAGLLLVGIRWAARRAT